MPVDGNDTREIIQPPFTTSPYPAVGVVDSRYKLDNPNGGRPTYSTGRSSGIFITPNHVLTAGHSVYKRGFQQAWAIRVTPSNDQNDLDSRTLPIINPPRNVSDSGVNYLYGYNNGQAKKDDIALLTTNQPLLPVDDAIGIIAFVNPENAVGKTIRTAGYPGDNISLPGYSGRDLGRDLVISPGSAYPPGSIIGVIDERRFVYSQDVDTFQGQSGSGVWHTLEGDNKPRVLGVHTDGGSNSKGVLITYDAYDRIIEETKDDSGIIVGNDLPENAIIGSDPGFFSPITGGGNDEITGTYRRERIIGNGGNDRLYGDGADDRLEGGEGNDKLDGGKGNDTLEGGSGDDELNGGNERFSILNLFGLFGSKDTNRDTAKFSGNFADYDYDISDDKKTITFDHVRGTGEDETDTLKNIEWAQFNDTLESTEELVSRTIPLPLEDGVEATEFIGAIDTTTNPNPYDLPTPPNATISAPVAMLDGDVDYTLNISPYQPDTEYNISYIFDTSASMDAVELQQAKDAYTDLTNYFIDSEIAENINFAVVQFSRNATPYFNLTAQEAISTIQGLTASTNGIEGTKYNDALYQGFNFLSQSPKDALNTTNIAYFVSDGRSRTNYSNPYDPTYHQDAQRLRRFSNVQAFGIDDGTNSPGGITQSQLNFVDSNQGLIVGDASNLSGELQKSGLAGDIQQVNILVDGEVVETVTPDQLTDTPLGLTYEGSVDELDVSIDAENIITAEVVFTPESNLAATTVEHTVTAGESEAVDGEGNPIAQSEDGNEDPFERMLDGGDSDDEITLGYADRGANGGAGGDYIIGNERDNIIDGGAGNDTISAYGGDDTITTGAGRDKVNGGEGIDTVVYNDLTYQGNNISWRIAANSVSYNNSDTLTDVEFIQFNDVRISADTLEITPVVEVAQEIIAEGNSGNTIAQVDLDLSTPAPVDVTFDYSSEDLDAVAGEDYLAKSGQVTIPAGETSARIDLEVIGDVDYEELEQFALNFSNLWGATFSNNRVNYAIPITIENDDILPLHVNAGQDNVYTDNLGKQWSANDGLSGGRSYANSNEIAQTDNDPLYQSEYLGEDFNYSQSVANGNYDVTLHFAEIYFNQVGRRVFDVSAEDQLILDNFDVFSNAGGKNIALEKTFTVGVNDGTLDLDFVAEVNNAKISAVEIKPAGTTIRTNGGEGNYTDSQGLEWLSNNNLSGGRNSSRDLEIAQTDDDLLYQTEYYGENFDYSQSVANGNYDVTLHFAETVFNDAGKRVFDVSAEDRLILDNFDVYREAGGKNIALEKTFTVGVNDGTLDLDFLAEVNNAKISAVEIQPSKIIALVNAGEDDEDNIYTDSLGLEWSANNNLSGGRNSSRDNAIAQTDNDLLYQTEYYGQDFDYSQSVANGNYDVTLHFAETVFSQVGKRVFDVSVEDRLILDDFDIISEAGGKDIALERTFTVGVNDGTLDLDFLAEVNNAKISAIEIKPDNTIARINGGDNVYTNSLGIEWLSNDGLSGGRNSSRDNEIAQTDDDLLYQSEYYGKSFDYSQSVANGNYDVTLHFAETVFNDAGRRVFDVSAEDQLILDNFDVYSEAGGKDIALERTFTVGVNDGTLDLNFLAEVNNAKISAVEIQPSII